MLHINKLIAFFSITILACLIPSQAAFFKKAATRWVVQKSSSLNIRGSSNVNKFECGIPGYYQTDTICFNANGSNSVVPLKGSLNINVLDLDCKNRIITKDLRKTLKAEDYPTLVIRFIALERMPVFARENKDGMKGWVEVELAGACKKFDIPFTLQQNGNSLMELSGVREFSFADFKLTPPKKIAGLVRVNDRFSVNFHLLLQQVAG